MADTQLTSRTWPEGTHVTLMSVPWDEAYRDVVAWSSADERDQWLDSRTDAVWRDTTTFTYLWPNQPVTVPVPYSAAYRYNYCVVDNPAQPVTGEGPLRRYCYFVTNVEYVSPQASRLTLQLDVMTTYAGEIELGRAFVERGHIALANSNARSSQITGGVLNQYMTLPEGLDVGSTYAPCMRHRIPVGGGGTADTIPKIVVVSTANLAADPGTIEKPALNVADGQSADGLPSGCNVYWMEIGVFKQFMEEMQSRSWVAQCIVAIYAFPGRLLSAGPTVRLFGGSVEMHFLGETESLTPESSEYWNIPNAVQNSAQGLGAHSDLVKLYAYPYSVIELSTCTGNPVYIKPQLIRGNELSFWWIGCALAPFARVGFFPRNYGTQSESMADLTYSFYRPGDTEPTTGIIPAGDFLDTCVWISDFPQFSIVNNAYITYMASTARTRQYQYQAAGWQLDRSTASAETALENAQTQLRGQREAYDRSLQGFAANTASTAWQAPVLEVGGIQTPSLAQAVGALSQGASVSGWNANNLMENITGLGSFNAQQAAQGNVASNNRALADRVNKGDYQNQIAGINATVQDAQLTPPSTSGQMGGEGFNWKNGLTDIIVTWKTVNGAALESVAAYFRRYGYAVRRWLATGTVRHMLCMEHFAYWKLLETYVTAAPANEDERQTIRGVFEKGVTLWDAPESIGTTDLTDNAPRAGYSY